MRLLLLLGCLLALAACGPTGPTEAGGPEARPLELVSVLPSPGELRGPPGEAADPPELARALSGRADPELAEALERRGPRAAATRHWRAPDGATLTVAAAVWGSHLIATEVGADAAALLLDAPGASAWSPSDVRGARGARAPVAGGREMRLAYSVGPNMLYVRSTGSVPEDTVVRAMDRLVLSLEGQTG